jgi:hypothetical protein
MSKYTKICQSSGYLKSLGILKGGLVEEIRKKSSEATITAFQQEDKGYKICVICQFKNPMHPYVLVIRRIFTGVCVHLMPTMTFA